MLPYRPVVIPAKAGIQNDVGPRQRHAGMTEGAACGRPSQVVTRTSHGGTTGDALRDIEGRAGSSRESHPLRSARVDRRDADRKAEFREIAVVLNPAAGRGAGRRMRARLEAASRQMLTRPGLPIALRIVETTAVRGAEDLACEAIGMGADLVIAAGGDGTLNGVINGVGRAGVTVGLIPLGTGNDFARGLGLPRTVEGALAVIAEGRVRSLDVGLCRSRRFINVAGCGFDAAVAERINRGLRSVSGTTAYVASVLATLMLFRPADVTVSVDGVQTRGPTMMCAIANGTGYGGGMRIAPDARLDDGLFDVCVIGACTRMEFMRSLPLVFRGAHVDPPLPVLVDGELAGRTPARFVMEPAGVRFVVPLRMSGVTPARGGPRA